MTRGFLNLAAILLAAAGLLLPAAGQSSSAGAASSQADAPGASFSWPRIAPLKRSFEFHNLPEIEPSVDLKIRSPKGKPLYRLLCHSDDYKRGPDLQYRDENSDFGGVLGCHLFSLYDQRNLGNLFLFDPLEPYYIWTRAVLNAGDVFGPCAGYPEHGALRHFRLRGMEITFRYSDIVFDDPKPGASVPAIRSFHFEVRVTSDPAAISSIAEGVAVRSPPALPDGRRDCHAVIPVHVPGKLSAAFVQNNGLAPPYPVITAATRTSYIDTNKEPEFTLAIRSGSGKVEYRLKCSYQGRFGINCGLYRPGSKFNLLGESVDVLSGLPRSLVRAEQLFGACAGYPDWGAVRTFRLRKMAITLQFSDVKFSSGRARPDGYTDSIIRAKVTATVNPDPSADFPAAVAPVAAAEFEESMHHAHTTAVMVSLLVAGLGILLAFATYYWKRISADRVAGSLKPLHTFLLNKWYFDELYKAVVLNGLHGCTRLLRWFDDTLIDGVVNGAGRVTRLLSAGSGLFDNVVVDGVVNGTAYVSGFFGLVMRKFQTGRVQTYVLYAVLSVMLFYFVFRLI